MEGQECGASGYVGRDPRESPMSRVHYRGLAQNSPSPAGVVAVRIFFLLLVASIGHHYYRSRCLWVMEDE